MGGKIILIKVAICDDNIKATSYIESLILKHEIKNKVEVSIYFSGEELFNSIKNGMFV